MDFFGRNLELSLLNDIHQRPGVQFLILYGRRRVSKTRLITQWSGGIDAPVFY